MGEVLPQVRASPQAAAAGLIYVASLPRVAASSKPYPGLQDLSPQGLCGSKVISGPKHFPTGLSDSKHISGSEHIRLYCKKGEP